jgi:hypothetical protein
MLEISKDFWNYAKSSMVSSNIEDIFVKWANRSNVTSDFAKVVWADVSNEIRNIFSQNILTPPPINTQPQTTPPNEPINEKKEESPEGKDTLLHILSE